MSSSKLLKEKVKARMLQNAAMLWNIADTDIEATFDPLVAMLIEGCVNEIEKIGNQIENTHARAVNRLAQLLTPGTITGYVPAHAIVYAKPIDEKCVIKTEAQFYFTKKITSEANSKLEINKQIFFSPVSSVKLTNGSVKYCAFHDHVYEVVNAYQKKIIAEAEADKQLKHACFWMGLDLSSMTDDLAGTGFYFDLKNNTEKNKFLTLLPYAKWSFNNIELKMQSGLPVAEKESGTKVEDEFNPDKKIETETMAVYNRHFISVAETTKTALHLQKCRLAYPDELKEVFATNNLQKLAGKCLWIKVEFPNPVTIEMLNDLTCNINCFPVVNKKLNDFTFRLAQNLNIVPLNTNDYFLSVNGVSSSDGFSYTDNPLSDSRNYSEGAFALRQSGIERFDSRNAVEIINYLIDLLRDESAAFSVLGNEFISSYLKQLNQVLALLEQRTVNQANLNEPASYLLIKPRKAGENIFVSFWTTNGEIANNIKSGNKLELGSGGDVISSSITLMTSTTGGRSKLDDLERLNAFRSSLVSRGRIVTLQDIRLFCLQELGKEIEEVKVKKGFMIADDMKSGFVQTIDVIIKVAKNNQSTPAEWKDMCDSLSLRLIQKSSGLTPIRVMTSEIEIIET